MSDILWERFVNKAGNGGVETVVALRFYIRDFPFRYEVRAWLNRPHVNAVDGILTWRCGNEIRRDFGTKEGKHEDTIRYPVTKLVSTFTGTVSLACSLRNAQGSMTVAQKRNYIALCVNKTGEPLRLISPIMGWPSTGPNFTTFSCSEGP